MNSAMFLLLWWSPPYARPPVPARTMIVMNSLAGIERAFHEREGSGRAIAVLVVPVMRCTHYEGQKHPLNFHKYQLTIYRNNDLARFRETSVTCKATFQQPGTWTSVYGAERHTKVRSSRLETRAPCLV